MDMNKTHPCIAAVPLLLVGLAFSGAAGAQASMDTDQLQKPAVRTMSCAQVDIDWNLDLVTQYPRLPEACHEVVINNGIKWARFEADFVRRNSDGSIVSDFKSPSGRSMGRYTLVPAPGQQVTLDGREFPFSALQRDQRISLYVPEGATGLVSQPAPVAQPARILRFEAPMAEPVQIAQASPQPRAQRLPNTAGPLPWFALGGMLSLLAGIGLRVGRRTW